MVSSAACRFDCLHEKVWRSQYPLRVVFKFSVQVLLSYLFIENWYCIVKLYSVAFIISTFNHSLKVISDATGKRPALASVERTMFEFIEKFSISHHERRVLLKRRIAIAAHTEPVRRASKPRSRTTLSCGKSPRRFHPRREVHHVSNLCWHDLSIVRFSGGWCSRYARTWNLFLERGSVVL